MLPPGAKLLSESARHFLTNEKIEVAADVFPRQRIEAMLTRAGLDIWPVVLDLEASFGGLVWPTKVQGRDRMRFGLGAAASFPLDATDFEVDDPLFLDAWPVAVRRSNGERLVHVGLLDSGEGGDLFMDRTGAIHWFIGFLGTLERYADSPRAAIERLATVNR